MIFCIALLILGFTLEVKMSKIQKHIKSTHIESIKPSNLERSNLQLRWAVFKQNKRAFYSLLIFLVLLVCSIFCGVYR